jgi:hypothetical protein
MRRVLAAYALFGQVEIAAWTAVVMWAYAVGGASLAGTVMVVQLVPSALLSPILVGWGERRSRGTALAVAHAALAFFVVLTLLALVAGSSTAAVVTASAGITILAATVRPLHYSVLPSIARSADELVSANALSSSAEQLAFLIGPVVAGIAVQFSGAGLAMAICTVLAAAASLLCLRLGVAAAVGNADGTTPTLRAALGGLVALRGDWPALSLLLVMTSGFVIGGALDVLALAFVTGPLGLEQTAAGLLLSATGLGGLVGAAIASSPARRRRLTGAITATGATRGLAIAGAGLVTALVPAMLLLAVAGMVGAIVMVCARTLLQRSVDDRLLTRVMAVQESTAQLGLALGAGIAPLLVAWISPRGALVALGLGVAFVVAAAAWPVRRLDARSVFRAQESAVLRTVPYFDLLPAFELERLAAKSRWRDVPAASDVVRQGEPGHEFFVVDQGDLVVWVDGVERNRLTAGDNFGEIALLRDVARTATVRSLTPARLLVVSGRDFLAAVMVREEGHALASQVSADLLADDERT